MNLTIFQNSTAQSGKMVISGTVTDGSGNPIAGASITILHLKLGTLTDSEGAYTLTIPERYLNNKEETVLARNPDYTIQTKPIILSPGSFTVNFQLKEDLQQTESLVSTGGTIPTPTHLLPFTVGSIGGNRIKAVPPVSAVSALQGKIPGVTVIHTNGKPGTGPSIRLRGSNSIELYDAPLIIVDGVILGSDPVDVDGLDIESIEVLKGASAAAIYGSRGANGVIHIKTERGVNLPMGQTRIMIRNEIGISTFPEKSYRSEHHQFKLTPNGAAYVNYGDEPTNDYAEAALDGDSHNEAFQDNPFPGETYDHVKQFFDSGTFMTNRINFSRNGPGTRFNLSFSNTREPGIVKGVKGYERQNIRLNIDHQLRSDLTLNSNLNYTSSWRDDPQGIFNPFHSLMLIAPMADLTADNEDGTPYLSDPDPRANYDNPLYLSHNQDLDFNRKRLLAHLGMTWTPVNWFNVSGSLSYDHLNRFDEAYYMNGFKAIIWFGSDGNYSDGHYERFHAQNDIMNTTVKAQVIKKLGDLSTITNIGYHYENSSYQTTGVSGDSLVASGLHDIDVALRDISNRSSREDVRAVGVSFHTHLEYKKKYLLDLMLLRKGCSLFGAEAYWQNYIRSAMAWRISEEDWWFIGPMQGVKIHFAYGTAGVRPPFSAKYETWTVDDMPERLTQSNANLKPALAAEHEMGLRMLLFNRFHMNVVYAHTVTKDQILNVPLPTHLGFENQWQNSGIVVSNIIEAELNATLLHKKHIHWSAGVVFDKVTQKVTELGRSPFHHGPNNMLYIKEGESLGAIYGKEWITEKDQLPVEYNPNLFQKNDDGYLVPVGPGNSWEDGIAKDLWGTRISFGYDQHGDYGSSWGMPIWDWENDRENESKIGDITPDFNVGFNTTFRWKGFSFYALLHAQIGGDIYNAIKQSMYRDLRHKDCDQYGKSDGTKKPIGYYRTLYEINGINSAFVEDGSYLKLREVSLRYTLNRKSLENFAGGILAHIFHRLTIGVIGRNLFTFTGYSGFDPEVGHGNATLMRLDNFGYPQYRTLTGLVEVEL